MNRAYKVIWSKVRNCYVVVSELAKRHAKAPSASDVKGVVAFVMTAAALSVVLGGYGAAWAEVGDNTNTFKNFAKGDLLKAQANNRLVDNEFNNSTGLKAINAHSAYNFGYSGKGISLGVFELDMVDKDQPELSGVVTWGTGNGLLGDHATHVAGIIAAHRNDLANEKNMHGVAYSSTLFSYGASVKPSFNNSIIAINESIGSPSASDREQFRNINHEAIDNGMIVVHAMGNESRIDGEFGITTDEPKDAVVDLNNQKYKNSYISVTGFNPTVSSDNSAFLYYFTNLAKSESETTVAAPGMSINSTIVSDRIQDSNSGRTQIVQKYDTQDGTSMAAPYVTGSIGLVKEAFPYMNSKQLVDSILTTANNTFQMSPFYCHLESEKESDEYVLKKVRIIIVNDSNNVRPDRERIAEGLRSIYNQYFCYEDNGALAQYSFKNFSNYDEFASYVSNTNGVLDSAFLTREEIFGQGLLDVGKAVQGIGAIDVDRLSDDDISSKYSSKSTYLYRVDTGKVADNYNKRTYSIWSNDIDEKNVGSDNIHAGLLKSGDVDLVLLGDNTGSNGYQGATVVTGGKLQIVRGVKGDVYAVGTGVAEINGSAHSVYAVDGGKVIIQDTDVNKLESTVSSSSQGLDAGSVAQLVADATVNALNKSWYEEALPEKTTVNIDGGLFALNKNGQDSVIDVKLQQSGSQIKGKVYQNGSSEINVDLSNGAKLIASEKIGVYDGAHYISNNLYRLNNLTLNNFGEVELSGSRKYNTFEIANLAGNDGIFTVHTCLADQKGDLIKVDNAVNTQSHFISVIDKGGYVSANEKSVKIAETPDTVTFKGCAQTVDNGTNSFAYTPMLDYISDESNRKTWYFYGFEGMDYNPVVEKPIVESGIYTTDTVLNKGIFMSNGTLKVIKGNSNAMQVNGRINNDAGIDFGIKAANISFVGGGAVSVNVNGGGLVSYGDLGSYGTHWENDRQGYGVFATDFSALQDFEVNYNYKSGDIYGIDLVNGGHANLDKNLSINMNQVYTGNVYDSAPNKVVALSNTGSFNVGGSLKINMNTSNLNTEGVTTAVVNEGNIKVDDSMELNIDKHGIVNNGDIFIKGKTEIISKSDSDVNFIKSKSGNVTFGDDVYLTNTNSSSKNNIGLELVEASNSDVASNAHFKKNLIVDFDGTALLVNNKNSVVIDGDIQSADNNKKVWVSNAGSLQVSNIKSDGVMNSGELNVSGNITTSYFSNTGNSQIQGLLIATKTDWNIGGNGMVTFDDGILKANGIFAEQIEGRGTLKANSLTTKRLWVMGEANIDYLNINGQNPNSTRPNVEISNNGKINVQNLIMKGEKNLWIENRGALNINPSKTGKVQFEGTLRSRIEFSDDDINKLQTNINISGKDSYWKGSPYGDNINIDISHGAEWYLPKVSYTQQHKGNAVLHDKGVIHIPIEHRGSLSTLSGTNGIFKFDIHQDKDDKKQITSGSLGIEKNNTKGAKHTIQLQPDSADFILTNDIKINPITLLYSSSERNDGYSLEFDIDKFDAGVFNYTPTLKKEVLSYEGTVYSTEWKVTDIKVTGATKANDLSEKKKTDNTKKTIEHRKSENPTKHYESEGIRPQAGNEIVKNTQAIIAPVFNEDIVQTVTSNLTKNTLATAVNNYIRLRNEYNNMEKRLGDLRYSNEENGLWARTFHGREDSGKYGFDSNYNAFQIGYDRKVERKNGGKWFIGGAVTSYDGKTNYVNAGRTENKSIGLALYGSYLGEKGHYVDIVARHSRLNTDLTSYATGTGARISGDYHNWGSSIGVEYGRRIELKKGYYVQPQAELIYGHVNGGNYSLNDGSRVSQSSISSWTARGGVSIGRKTSKGNIYASFSVLHDFGDDSRFTISDKYGKSYTTINNLKDTWCELSIGGNAKLNENTYVYADVERTFGGDIRTKWRYNAGIRYSF